MSALTAYVYYQGFFAAIEGALLSGSAPILVVEGGRVLDLCPGSARAGVVEGMPVGNALSRCPAARIRIPEPARYMEWGDRLLEMAEPMSPAIEQPGANELYLDSGPAPREMIDLLRDLPVPGHRLVAVLAPGRTLAGALGRWRRRLAVSGNLDLLEAGPGASRVREAVKHLPLEYIAPHPSVAGSLARLGIRTAGEAASLPPGFLTDRFGEAGLVLSRLCRGQDSGRIKPRQGWARARVDLGEDGTASEEDVLKAVSRLAAELGQVLDGRGFGRLRLEVWGRDGWRAARDLDSGRVLVGDALDVCLLNLWRKIRAHGIPGPVTAVGAGVRAVAPAPQKQLALVGRERSRRAARDLCSSLKERFPVHVGYGKEDRRELVLSHWDPMRFGGDSR